MTAARRLILDAIARSLGRDGRAQPAPRATARPAAILPPEAALEGPALVAAFVAAALRAGATCEDVGAAARVPQAVHRFLMAANLPPRVRMGEDGWLAGLPWRTATGLDVHRGRAGAGDAATLTRAFCAVAETGTLVQPSGADNPSTLVCLPEAHVAAVTRDRVFGAAEQAWRAWMAASRGQLPRAMHWITGPSRTADIEQTLLMGAHGPRRLHILISDPT